MENNNVKTKILQKSKELFFSMGFYKVTMDEIASALGMSKKTIYKYFPTKKFLIRAVIDKNLEEISAKVGQIASDENQTHLEKIKNILSFISEKVSEIKKVFLDDVRIYEPEIWQELNEFRQDFIKRNFGKILQDGINDGIFRNDINPELLLIMYVNLMQATITPEVLSQIPFTAKEVFDTMIKIIFEGILTDEARGNMSYQ